MQNWPYFDYEGKEEIIHEDALAILLDAGVLFSNSRKYVESFKDEPLKISNQETIVLFVACNDVFAWGCADDEELAFHEVDSLFREWHKDNKYGPIKWVCKKRNLQPQSPLVTQMKDYNVWDAEMEALPRNPQ